MPGWTTGKPKANVFEGLSQHYLGKFTRRVGARREGSAAGGGWGEGMSGEVQPLLEALKAVAVVFKHAQLRFALAGGYAVYARGGHRSTNDVDFVIAEEDVAAARDALEDAGLTVIQPPEDWLFKARHGPSPVDVIYRLPMGPVGPDLFDRADLLSVESVAMPVLSATDLLTAKLLALSDHNCDLEPVVALTRSLREQLDPTLIATACEGRPFAEAALFLTDRLGVLPWKGRVDGPIRLTDQREGTS